jgi:hypothetical protein
VRFWLTCFVFKTAGRNLLHRCLIEDGVTRAPNQLRSGGTAISTNYDPNNSSTFKLSKAGVFWIGASDATDFCLRLTYSLCLIRLVKKRLIIFLCILVAGTGGVKCNFFSQLPQFCHPLCYKLLLTRRAKQWRMR